MSSFILTKPNKKNPLGLFSKDGEIFSVLGFFHYHALDEFDLPVRTGIPMTRSSLILENHTEYGFWTPVSNVQQLRHFGLDPSECFVLLSFSVHCFVFKRYKEQISFSDTRNIAKLPSQALFDYIEANKKIKIIASPQKIMETMRKEIDNRFDEEQKDNYYYKHYVDKKSLERSLKRIYHSRNGLNTDKLNRNEDTRSAKEKEQEEHKLFLYKLKREEIESSVLLKGGTVPLLVNVVEYNIPLMPLMAWHNSPDNKLFDFAYWHWNFKDKKPLDVIFEYIETENIPEFETKLKNLAENINEDDYLD